MPSLVLPAFASTTPISFAVAIPCAMPQTHTRSSVGQPHVLLCRCSRNTGRNAAMVAGAVAMHTLPCKRRCGPNGARPSSADAAPVAGLLSFAPTSCAATPEGMQLDGDTDVQHAAGGLGAARHAVAGPYAAHQRGCDAAIASVLPPYTFISSSYPPAAGWQNAALAADIQAGVQPERQRAAELEQDEDMRSPLPDALLSAGLLPALAGKKSLRNNAQRTQPGRSGGASEWLHERCARDDVLCTLSAAKARTCCRGTP